MIVDARVERYHDTVNRNPMSWGIWDGEGRVGMCEGPVPGIFLVGGLKYLTSISVGCGVQYSCSRSGDCGVTNYL